jgi:hypothetical protein
MLRDNTDILDSTNILSLQTQSTQTMLGYMDFPDNSSTYLYYL